MSRLLRLLVLLIAVCTIALVWERGREPDLAEPPLLTLVSPDVIGIRVQMGTRRLRAVRDGDAWRVVDPPAPRSGASDAVATLVEAIVGLVPVDTFERHDLDRRQLGVEPGRALIELDVRGAPGKVVLALGDFVPTRGSVYAVLDSDPRIFQLGALIVSEIEAAFYRAVPDASGDGAR